MLAKTVMARSRSLRVIDCSAGCSSLTITSADSGTSSPVCGPHVEARDVLGPASLVASRRRRTSMRRPPELYLPTRTPPTSALMVVATSSIETPRSAARARFGVMRSSGMPSW